MSLFEINSGAGITKPASYIRNGNIGLDSIKSVADAPSSSASDIDTGLGFNQLGTQKIQLVDFSPSRYDNYVPDRFNGYNRIDLEVVNALNGEVTYGVNRGDRVEPTGVAVVSGVYPDNAITDPTQIVVTHGSSTPSVKTY